MKKAFLLLTFAAFSTAAFAQEPMKTETKVRSNGTVKTETRTGPTEAGEVVHDAKEGTKYAGQKTGQAVKRGAAKTGHVVKKGANKTGHAVKKGAKAVKNTAVDVVD
ncbi:hypothetical protein SAMN02745146_1075 [Hymenobacter daecheongensis DSM 21074]|uniref:Uncharacterized protein n=1 Tax=Hymenobacter daecheongensis DSM 21074 TaxID=1121955 RepID=A0A1M6C930_9BACT|nr:hypothetical protein [Hymenobacter daecheongensis]SHI57486.1 hypothetical protein SAMN02745146_1075 [Hymenobacter daecheongensis DSM 21074]